MNGLHPVEIVIISILTEANDYVDTRNMQESIDLDAIELSRFIRLLVVKKRIERHPDTDFKVRIVQAETVVQS